MEDLKEKIQERKNNKAKLGMLFNQGTIDKNQYYTNMKRLDENLL